MHGDVSVIMATYHMDRRGSLREAVASLQNQTAPVSEIVVVVDHNPVLLTWAQRELSGVTVIPNSSSPGASGARNSGVAVSRSSLIAFVDDDAVAPPEWLATVLPHLTDPDVVGVGSRVIPLWERCRPWWFPPEFDWIVGASYLGMPNSVAAMRNVWSNSMLVRRTDFDTVGGFRTDFSKIGERSLPEDTDFCIRMTPANRSRRWVYEPGAVMGHRVPQQRTRFMYFLRRCYREGWGKARLAALASFRESTSTEWHYIARVLPASVCRGLLRAATGKFKEGPRSFVIVIGFFVAALGFFLSACLGSRAATRAAVAARQGESGSTDAGVSGKSIEPSRGNL